MQRDAEISSCRKYRFSLTRAADGAHRLSPTVAFVLCNPSTADDEQDDQTVRRCWAFTQRWGYDRMLFVNVNPYRSTDPHVQLMPEPWALEENIMQLHSAALSEVVICAWGMYALVPLADRARNILKQLTTLYYLALCKDGKTPKHPLYLPRDSRPISWNI